MSRQIGGSNISLDPKNFTSHVTTILVVVEKESGMRGLPDVFLKQGPKS